jgi:peptidyl-prolyl cis-trans isomerase A (cyclophilin A)
MAGFFIPYSEVKRSRVKYFVFLSLAVGLVFSASALGAPPYDTNQTTPKVAIETTFGDITIELFPNKAPISVSNFLQYVNSGFYDGLMIHRSTNTPTFEIIQGGGYYFSGGGAHYKSAGLLPPIINESYNGLSNLRATVGMARTKDSNSATSQFYINVTNNTGLDRNAPGSLDPNGYCVFGQVVSGMDIVDQIQQLPILGNPGPNDGYPYYLSNSLKYPVIVYKQQVRVCISPTGNDSTGIGSPDVPFKTIQKGIDIIASPGHVVPAPATYTGTGNVDLDFKGKAITVRAIEPRDFNAITKTVINCQSTSANKHRTFYFHTAEDANSVVKGLTIINGYQTNGGAILCQSSSPTIKNCTFTNNTASSLGGAIFCSSSRATIKNCTFSKNTALSTGGALCVGDSGNAILTNSILWNNTAPSGNEIALNGLAAQAAITISYSDIEGGQAGVYKVLSNPVTWGPGNLDTDPCFVNYDSNNLNLQSTIWQWDDVNGWGEGKNNSLCIDAGNPGCDLGDEGITTANVRINMGAAGGTVKASVPPLEWRLLADIDNDGITDNIDFAWFASYWLAKGSELPADLDRDGSVDISDLKLFTDDWMRMGNTRLADKAYFNFDGIVNFRDFAALASEWQKSVTNKTHDLNGDGIIDIDDLDLFTQVWLQ